MDQNSSKIFSKPKWTENKESKSVNSLFMLTKSITTLSKSGSLPSKKSDILPTSSGNFG